MVNQKPRKSKSRRWRNACTEDAFHQSTLWQKTTNRPNTFHRAYRCRWAQETVGMIGSRKDQNLGSMLHDILFKIISFVVLILWKLKVNKIQNLFSVSLWRQKKRNVNVCYSYSPSENESTFWTLVTFTRTTNVDILSQFFMNVHWDKNHSSTKLV